MKTNRTIKKPLARKERRASPAAGSEYAAVTQYRPFAAHDFLVLNHGLGPIAKPADPFKL